MAKLFDVQHPFFLPKWRRVTTVAACLGWALLELSWGNPGWAMLFGAVGLYCGYQFFVAFDPKDYADNTPPASPPKGDAP